MNSIEEPRGQYMYRSEIRAEHRSRFNKALGRFFFRRRLGLTLIQRTKRQCGVLANHLKTKKQGKR